MNIKQTSFLAIATTCTLLCNLFLIFWYKNFTFFNYIDLNITSLLCSAFSCLPFTLLLKFFIVNLSNDEESSFPKLNKELVWFFGLLIIFQVILWVELSGEKFLQCLFTTIYSSILVVFISMVKGYDEVDLAKSQDDQCSIGAYWATGTTMAYYEKTLEKFKDRLKNFEENHPSVKFFVKKLVLIVPLSCNTEGSLKDRGDEITHIGDLQPIECDQGANINRHLITPVYKISKNEEIFIAAEFPSPLGTLWGERHKMEKNVRVYIRDCFLKELKEQLKPYPVIILEYDDENPTRTVPLHHFIVSSLQNYQKENNIYF